MKKIIVTVGISNSGKSTFARQAVGETVNTYVIVNRDKIRELLFGYTEETISEYYNRADISAREKQVTKYEDTLINEVLAEGKTPIVDATHLSRKYLERFKYWNVEVELVWFDIMLKEAFTRNMGRTRQVPQEIMIKQYNQYVGLRKELEKNPIDFTPISLENDENLPSCVIFDIDGTIAHKGDRSPYDWLAVGKDTIDLSTCLIMDYLNRCEYDPQIIICTGRDGVSLDETQKWLDTHNLGYDDIYIRPKGDMRPDWVVKEEMWRAIASKFHIVGMFDDRLQVVRRARALGLKVFNVEYNNF